MAFLIQTDYDSQIKSDQLQNIIGFDSAILAGLEVAAIEEIFSYLGHLYDTTLMFATTLQYSDLNVYAYPQRVQYKEPSFVISTVYAIGDRVEFEGDIYEALQVTTGTETPANVAFWLFVTTNGNLYTVKVDTTPTAGTRPTDAAFWVFGDDRNPLIVLHLVDIILYHAHSRINPRNIPELRFERYESCKKWFMSIGRGEMAINSPRIEDESANRIFGGSDFLPSNKY